MDISQFGTGIGQEDGSVLPQLLFSGQARLASPTSSRQTRGSSARVDRSQSLATAAPWGFHYQPAISITRIDCILHAHVRLQERARNRGGPAFGPAPIAPNWLEWWSSGAGARGVATRPNAEGRGPKPFQPAGNSRRRAHRVARGQHRLCVHVLRSARSGESVAINSKSLQ